MFKYEELEEVHFIRETTSYLVVRKENINKMIINNLSFKDYLNTNLDEISSFYIESVEPEYKEMYGDEPENSSWSGYFNDIVYIQFIFSGERVMNRNLTWYSDYDMGVNYLQRVGKSNQNFYFYFDQSDLVPKYFENIYLEMYVKYILNKPIDHILNKKDIKIIKKLSLIISDDSIFKSFESIGWSKLWVELYKDNIKKEIG